MLGTISMLLCMFINMLGKYYSFFILKCINNGINQKKRKKKKKNLKFDMRSSVKRDEYLSRWVGLGYGCLKKIQSAIQLDWLL